MNFLRIDDNHALGGGKPDATLAVLAARRLVVTAIAFAAQHSVRFSQREDLRLCPPASRDFIQLLPRDSVDTAQTAQPKIAEVILLNVVDDVLTQAVLGRESEKAICNL